MKTAYLLEPPKFDVSELYDKYHVKMVLESKTARTLRDDPDALYEVLYVWAETCFLPDQDVFVLTGNQTMLVVAALAISAAHPNNELHFLRYDNTDCKYLLVTIPDTKRGPYGQRPKPIAANILPLQGGSQTSVPAPHSHKG